MNKSAQKLLEEGFEKLGMTVRSYHKIIKVAQTVVDLEGAKWIEERHIAEAMCYRMSQQKFWN